MAVEYACVRVQFERPIGSFQSVKHKCAAVAIELELARTAAMFAVGQLDNDATDLATAASVAKAVCSGAFVRAAKENIQVHGGIGYTWDHPAHLYLKRAKANQVLFGDTAMHRCRITDLVGL
jgi:alkylation response protein AidB-like acyl-CoA dehydrogenase